MILDTSALGDVEARQRFLVWSENEMLLTPTEARIVRALGLGFGTWLSTQTITSAVYVDTHQPELLRAEVASLRTHMWRIRRKLERTPWRIQNRYAHGLYRLVECD